MEPSDFQHVQVVETVLRALRGRISAWFYLDVAARLYFGSSDENEERNGKAAPHFWGMGLFGSRNTTELIWYYLGCARNWMTLPGTTRGGPGPLDGVGQRPGKLPTSKVLADAPAAPSVFTIYLVFTIRSFFEATVDCI